MALDPKIIRELTIRLSRNYFINKNFKEIDVPILLSTVPLEPNIYPLKTTWAQKNKDFFLATSPESSLKKLISQGLGNCFAIGKCFRDLENTGPQHHFEFSMLEWYEMDKNYLDIASAVEKYILDIYHGLQQYQNVCPTNFLNYQGQKIDLTPPYYRITLQELFEKFTTIDLVTYLKSASSDITNWEPDFTQIFINQIESQLPKDKPVFILDYPSILSPLAKKKKDNPLFSERFELYIGSMEIANGNTESTEPQILKNNFQINTLPASAGIGLGIDRLSMLFADTQNISDILYFSNST